MTKAEACWQGNMQEIKVGMLIATPVDENDLGHQFWIGNVLDMVMHKNHALVQHYEQECIYRQVYIGDDGMPNVKRK